MNSLDRSMDEKFNRLFLFITVSKTESNILITIVPLGHLLNMMVEFAPFSFHRG